MPAVRGALGDEATLLVDANSCYTPARAIEVGRMLEAHGVVHFEEPCPYWELEWTAEVAAALDLDVTGGEQDCLMPTWRRMFELRAVDVAQPDVCYVGGLTRTLRVAAMAEAAGLPVVPHSANLTLVTVFSLHLMGAIANAGPYVEYSIEPDSYYPWQRGLFEPELVVKDGAAQIPPGPGWGVEIRRGLARPRRARRLHGLSAGSSDRDLEVDHRSAVHGLQCIHPQPAAVPLEHGHGVQADRVGPVGRAGREHAGQRPAAIVAGIHQQGRAVGQMQPGQHHDPSAWLEAVQRFGVGRVDGQPGGRGALAGLAGRVGAVAQGRFDHADHQHPIVVAAEHGGTVLRAVISAPLLHRRWW